MRKLYPEGIWTSQLCCSARASFPLLLPHFYPSCHVAWLAPGLCGALLLLPSLPRPPRVPASGVVCPALPLGLPPHQRRPARLPLEPPPRVPYGQVLGPATPPAVSPVPAGLVPQEHGAKVATLEAGGRKGRHGHVWLAPAAAAPCGGGLAGRVGLVARGAEPPLVARRPLDRGAPPADGSDGGHPHRRAGTRPATTAAAHTADLAAHTAAAGGAGGGDRGSGALAVVFWALLRRRQPRTAGARGDRCRALGTGGGHAGV